MFQVRSRNPQRSVAKDKDHDTILSVLVKQIEHWPGWTNIKADHIGYPNGAPELIRGSRPDVTARNANGAKFVFEVETAEALDTDHTKGQLDDFVSDSTAHVFLVMQETYIENGRALPTLRLIEHVLKKWGLTYKVNAGLQTHGGSHKWFHWSNGVLVES